MTNFCYKIILGLMLTSVGLQANEQVEVEQAALGKPTKNMKYNGGPVITSVKIVDVLWGADVNPQVKASMPFFFSALVTGTWLEGLSQYNTVGKNTITTNQFIGLGTFVGQYLIHPGNYGRSVSEAEIQFELKKQFDSENLPLPEYDETGNPETVYVIEFPPHLKIVAKDRSVSCQDFCSMHSSMNYRGRPVLYSIQPDFTTGACSTKKCGKGTMLQDQQAAHCGTLAEMITNAMEEQNNPGWSSKSVGEIGDYCPNQTTDLVINGKIYTVQLLWSNVDGKCVSVLPSIPAPVNVAGTVIETPNGLEHRLTWLPSPTPYLNGYRIIQGGQVLAIIPPEGPYEVIIPARDANQVYTYRIVAFNDSGIQSTFRQVTLP